MTNLTQILSLSALRSHCVKARAYVLANRRKSFLVVVLICGGAMALHMRKPALVLDEVRTEHFDHTVVSVNLDTRVQALKEEYLVLRKGGALDQLKVSVGDRVEAGAIIALIDAGRHEARLRRALSQFRLASAEYARSQKLFASATETRQSLDLAQNTLNVARSEVEEAKKDLEDSLIKAPFAGTVSFLAFKQGDYIPDGGRVAVIEDRSSFVLRGRLAKEFRQYFPYEGQAEMQLPGQKEKREVEKVMAKATSEEGFFSEDFDVEVQLPSLPETLTVGREVRLTLPVAELKDVVRVPLTALDQSQDQARVLVLEDNNELHWQDADLVLRQGSQAYIRTKKMHHDVKVVQAPDMRAAEAVAGKKVRPTLRKL